MTPERARATAAVAVGGVALLVGLLWWRRRVPPMATADNADWLARIMVVEAADATSAEGVGIGFVAKNRATRAVIDKSIRAVVTARAGASWFGAAYDPGYCYATGDPAPPCATRSARPGIATSHPKYPAAKVLAQGILDGTVANPVGDRTMFLHPWGVGRCAAAGEPCLGRSGRPYGTCQDWSAISPSTGMRCIDFGHLPRTQGGTAAAEQLRVGPAVFSGFGIPLLWAALLPGIPP